MRLSYSPLYSDNSFQNIICWKSCVPSVGLFKGHRLAKGLRTKKADKSFSTSYEL